MAKQQKYITNYLEKQSLYSALIAATPASNLSLIVTIPCYNESGLLDTLNSLRQCELPPQKSVEVIVLINNAVDAELAIQQQNELTFQTAQDWSHENSTSNLRFHILYHKDLARKNAGVGLARKIAMDEAVRRFDAIEHPTGIIACLDADSLVEKTYFQAICDFFHHHPSCPTANIYYEHPLEGVEYEKRIYQAILDYELHLRYYVHALREARLQNATQTVGSAMAVRAVDYAKQGGMNRRKAGEDFYFLHKFTAHKHFGSITKTTVFPSPRISNRVPFGTGKAVNTILEGHPLTTYHPNTFDDLKIMLSDVEQLYTLSEINAWQKDLPKSVQYFLEQENFATKWKEFKANTSNTKTFQKRFFQWFDAFKAMKYVHFVRDRFYPNLPVEDAVNLWFTKHTNLEVSKMNKKDSLLYFRRLDKK